jgi:hypothetical protein
MEFAPNPPFRHLRTLSTDDWVLPTIPRASRVFTGLEASERFAVVNLVFKVAAFRGEGLSAARKTLSEIFHFLHVADPSQIRK